MGRVANPVISEATWIALLARFPGGVVPPHFTIWGRGPGYLTTADLTRVQLPPAPVVAEGA